MSDTKVRMIPTFLVLSALGIAALVVNNLPSHPRKKDQPETKVILAVTFDPPKRSGKPLAPGRNLTDAVTIQVTVGSTGLPTRRETSSPWGETISAQRGDRVVLYVEQFSGKSLSCSITEPGVKTVKDTKPGPATLSCILTVI